MNTGILFRPRPRAFFLTGHCGVYVCVCVYVRVCVCVLLYTNTETCQPSDAYTFFFFFFYSNPFNLAACVKLLQAMMQACQLDRLHVKKQNPQAPLYPLLIVLFKKKRSSSAAFFFSIIKRFIPTFDGKQHQAEFKRHILFFNVFLTFCILACGGAARPKTFSRWRDALAAAQTLPAKTLKSGRAQRQAEGGADRADSLHLSHGGAAQRRKMERGGEEERRTAGS